MESTPTLTINSLPCELLLRILLLLPLRTRGLVEGVCKKWREALLSNHWRDVHHYDDRGEQRAGDTNNYPLFSRRRQQLLHLIGTELKSATLSMENYRRVRDALGQCPNLMHLKLRRRPEGSCPLCNKAFNFIRREFAPRLKTLSLVRCTSHCHSKNGENARQAFCELLRELISLEYIHLVGLQMPREFVFPEEMKGLMKLWLHSCYNTLLSKVTCHFRSSLRSLTIDSDDFTDMSTAIGDFPQLRHLRLRLRPANISSFIDNVLPQAEKLKALEVIDPYYPYYPSYYFPGIDGADVQRLFAALNAHIPQLEHLGIAMANDELEFKRKEETFSALGRMKGLKSLELRMKCGDAAEFDKWDWLEGMSALQHLALTGKPSLTTLCTVVERCRELRYMDLGGFVPDADACAALAVAATAAGGGNRQTVEEVKDEHNAEKPHLLSLRVDRVRGLDGIDIPLPISGKDFGCARMHFVSKRMCSHVLYHHAYGFLTEGKPKWEEEHSLMKYE